MKALTIRQPWADAIAHGTKRVENRTRRTHVRGSILIHAGLTGDRQAVLDGIEPGPDMRGAIIAVVSITASHLANGCCCPWGQNRTLRSEPAVWHWVLDDVTALAAPVPAKGSLGFWTPPADVLAAVYAQMPETVR